MLESKEKKPINCKYFYVPEFNSKALYRQGYCQKITGMCLLLENRNIMCLLKEKRYSNAEKVV